VKIIVDLQMWREVLSYIIILIIAYIMVEGTISMIYGDDVEV
jgi:hypothetical protein